MPGRKHRKNNSEEWNVAEARILEKTNIKAFYESLGVVFTDREASSSGWSECYAFGRDDANPSAAVNTHGEPPELGRYKDSGGPSEYSLAIWNFAAEHGNGQFSDWRATRLHLANLAGIQLPSAVDEVSRPADRIKPVAWNDALAEIWCRRKPGLTLAALKAAGARLAKWPASHTQAPLCVALPAYGPHFTADDPTGFVLWNQSGLDLRKWNGKGKPYTFHRMLVLGNGWIVLGDLAAAEVVWKTEGPSDLLTLWAAILSAGKIGSAAFSNLSGSKEHADVEMLAHLAGKTVYVVHDADQPGLVGGEKWAAAIAGVARETRHVKLPYGVQPDSGKDLRDWLNEGHGYAELVGLAMETAVFEPPARDAATRRRTSLDVAGQSANGELQALESEDDPHRLARVFLARQASAGNPEIAGAAGREFVLRYWREEWWRWLGRSYRQLAAGELKAEITACVKDEFDRLNQEAQHFSSADRPTPTAQKVTRAIIGNIVGALEGESLILSQSDQPCWIEGDIDRGIVQTERRAYIALANGILDLDALLVGDDLAISDVLLSHSPRWFSAVCLPYAFDPDAACPTWEAFLARNLEGDAERISLLQEWAGYLLLPDTNQQKFLILEGEGANGKSVYCAAISAMLGSDNVSHVPLEIFGQRFALTPTIGKLANIAADVGEIEKTCEGYLKSFTSGDTMFFDRKGVPGFNARPTARLMMALNNRPRFSDRSSGIWRRMLLVPFLVEIPKPEQIKGMDKPDWWEASGELPGIFNWAIAGLHRLREQGGFTKTTVGDEAKDDYQLETNPARAFLEETCQEEPTCKLPVSELYTLYKNWCKDSGFYPLSDRQFGKEVKRKFKKSEKKRLGEREDRQFFYIGISYQN